jgi:peptidoglycan hydrolase FlgJ
MVAPLVMAGLSVASNVVGSVANAIGGAPSTPKGSDPVRKTADDFETMFLEQSFDRLTSEAGAEGPLGENGTGGAVYRSMLSGALAKEVVKTGGVGISDQIYKQMLQLQESSHGAGR